MYIYHSELQAGLMESLLAPANCKATAYCQIIKSDQEVSEETRKALSSLELTQSSISDIDLYPIRTILVTTGTNKNDDVFEKDEVWGARHTPEHKPFNIEHNPDKVIGHMIKSIGVNTDYTEIPDETVVTELPDKFHLLTDAVIYRREGAIAELISEIEDGKWFVSMECLFNNFDYLKIDKAGASSVIKRDESTAHLTKHLRIYGGTGNYNGDTYYRVLRNLVFSGKGLVKNPANPESVILNSAGVNSLQDNNNSQENNMSKELEQQIAELKTQLEAQAKSFSELQATQEATAQTVAALMTEKDELKASVDTLTASKAEIEATLASKNEEIANLTKATEDLKVQLVKASRTLLAVDKGLDKQMASELVEKWVSVSDEQFIDILDLAVAACGGGAKKKAKAEEDADAAAKDDKKKKEVMPCGDKAKCSEDENIESDPAGEKAAAETIIDETKVESSATPTAEETPNQMETTRAALQEYFCQVLGVKRG